MALDLWICTNFCSVIVFYCNIGRAECLTRNVVVLGNCTYLECRSRIRQAGVPCGGSCSRGQLPSPEFFVESGVSGAGDCWLRSFLAVLADVGDPGGFVLVGATHADS